MIKGEEKMPILYIILIFIFLILPLFLTLVNIINLFKKKKIKENLTDSLIFLLGIPFTILLYWMHSFQDYQKALHIGGGELGLHSPIASWSIPTVFAILALGIISYALIRIKKLKLSPLVIVCSMSGIFICSVYMIIWIIQLSNNIIEYAIFGISYLALFPINYILCGIRAEIEIMKKYKQENLERREFENKFLNSCYKLLFNIDNWPILAIVFSIPLILLLISILMLFGQRPDEAIKAFLETSDWTLSTKISPPPIEYDAHYLCTVSLRGHKNVVKPIRMGIRHGKRIVVNRQLCVANAFEDLIQEKTPKFHHFVRYIYDKYGYPLSKHINTSVQADITYILMKPLEWIFLIVLYTFDVNPEDRIAIQYMGNKKPKI